MAAKEIANDRRVVHTAGCAREAFELLQRHPFDVIVLDIRLPDGDGLDLLEKFREAFADVEVVLITATEISTARSKP